VPSDRPTAETTNQRRPARQVAWAIEPKTQSFQGIPVERAIAELEKWCVRQRLTGRRDPLPETTNANRRGLATDGRAEGR